MALELFPTPSWPRPSFYIPLYPETKKFPGKNDMVAKILQATESSPQEVISYWACDNIYLFIAIEVPWQAEIPSWDEALVLTVSHHTDSPTCFTSLGFAGTSRHPRVTSMCLHGRPFSQLDCSKIKFVIDSNPSKTLFAISVPWSLLKPVRPLLYETIAINLSIPWETPEGRSLYQLVEDNGYASNRSRQLYPMGINTEHLSEPHAQSFLTSNLWQGNKPLQINLGLFNPKTCPAKLDLAIKEGDSCLEAHSSSMELGSGCHHWTLRWSPQRPLPSGEYIIELGGQGCGKTYLKKHPFFVINPSELSALKGDLLKLEEDINCRHPVAVQTALGHLDWMEEKCPNCSLEEPKYKDFLLAREMRDSLQNGNNPLEDKPGLSLRAFRSETDDTLRKYGLYLPRGFRPQRKWPLLILLHEQGASSPELYKVADKLGLVLIFPQARYRSGSPWSDDDIMENLAATKQSLPLDWDKVFIGGIAAGGDNAFTAGLGHPEHFSGLAVITGTPCQPFCGETQRPSLKPEDFPPAAPMLPILVIQGAQDKTTGEMAELVAALREQGAKPDYIKIPRTSREDFNWVPELYSWLKLQLKA